MAALSFELSDGFKPVLMAAPGFQTHGVLPMWVPSLIMGLTILERMAASFENYFNQRYPTLMPFLRELTGQMIQFAGSVEGDRMAWMRRTGVSAAVQDASGTEELAVLDEFRRMLAAARGWWPHQVRPVQQGVLRQMCAGVSALDLGTDCGRHNVLTRMLAQLIQTYETLSGLPLAPAADDAEDAA